MQKDDFDLALFLPYLLNQAAERSSQSFQAIYRERYGMLRTDWRVLFHLGLYGQMTAQGISQRASIHKTKVSRAVQRLSAMRFLQRNRDADDRRREFLVLTPAGQRAYADLHQEAQRYEHQLTKSLSAEDTTALKRVLALLAQAEAPG